MPKTPHPDYLDSLNLLSQHIRGQLEGLTTTEKGKRFAQFVQRLVPQTENGSGFDMPELNRKLSNDGGVDLVAQGKSVNGKLYIQSKLHIDRADTIDSIVSKFEAYRSSEKDQLSLLEEDNVSDHFLIATLSPLAGIRKKYEKQQYASKAFYDRCLSEKRIYFIDGQEILSLLKTAHSKLNQVPTKLTIEFETSYIRKDNVYVGIISNSELRKLYQKFGDALFFENVRDFLGVQNSSGGRGRTTPNLEIIKTIQNAPDKMLSRNNGLVLGAKSIMPGTEENQLILESGSVVNGCQTTMCVVEYSERPCFVLLKLVQTPDAWDITKSANYQTAVPDIDLELARYLRPQLVNRSAEKLGVQLEDRQKSAFQLIDEIHDRKVAYSETRLLYIGLFSRTPNNVFASNYTELLQPLIEGIYKTDIQEEEIFGLLFSLQDISRKSLSEARDIFSNPSYSGLFDRLYRDDSLSYRTFLSILGLCGSTNVDIVDRESDIDKEVVRIRSFIKDSETLITTETEKFKRFHKMSIKLWMQDLLENADEGRVRQTMHASSKQMNFRSMFKKLCVEADLSSRLN